MPNRKFTVTLVRTVTETVTLSVDARTKQDAAYQAQIPVEQKWNREVGPTRVGSVEREAADPMAVPAALKREPAAPEPDLRVRSASGP